MLLTLRALGQARPCFSVLGFPRLELLAIVLDAGCSGVSASFRSCSWIDLLLPTSDAVHFRSLLASRSLAKLDFFVSPFGLARPDSVFSLPVLDRTHLRLPSPLRSFPRLDVLTLTPGCTQLESLSSFRGMQRLETMTMPLGASRSASPFFVLDSAHSSVALASKSVGRPGALLSVVDVTFMGLLLPSKSPAKSGSPTTMLRAACLESLILMVDLLQPDPPPLSHSFGYPSAVFAAPGFSHLRTLPSFRGIAQAGFSSFVSGLARLRLVSSPLAPDRGHLGAPLSPRLFAWPGLFLATLDRARLDVPLVPQSVGWMGVSSLVSGLA